MFTGIIKQQAPIINREGDANGLTLIIEQPTAWTDVQLGDSITINGVCSTVKSLDGGMHFEYMPESLQKATILSLKVGQHVNLEQSLTLQHKLDGHMIVGHVDTIGHVRDITPEGNSQIFTINVDKATDFMQLLAEKGSVSIDGISLTVVDVFDDAFTVKIIPYTLEETNLGTRKVGDAVNLEFDLLAKYVQRLLNAQK